MRRSAAPAAIGSGRRTGATRRLGTPTEPPLVGANLGWHDPSDTGTPDGPMAPMDVCQPKLAPTRSRPTVAPTPKGQLSASAASRVFCINVATVLGPTPPGP